MNTLTSRCFTLVELLIVIAIMTIIAAIILPVMQEAKEAARGIACLSNMRQQGMAITMYKSDNTDIYGYNYPPWLSRLNPNYLDSKGVFTCPCDPQNALPSQISYSETNYVEAFDTNGQPSKNPKKTDRIYNRGLYGKDITKNPKKECQEDLNNPNPNVPQVSYMYDFNQAPYAWYNSQNKLSGKNVKSWCQAKQDFIRGTNLNKTDLCVNDGKNPDKATDPWSRENLSKRLNYYPVVRCFWHIVNKKKNDPIRNLSVSGNVFYSNGKWETKGVWSRGDY